MLQKSFADYIAELPLLKERLLASTPLDTAGIRQADHPGVYCFFEQSDPLYLGRTKNFAKRHKNHCGVGSGENMAALAFQLAREATGKLQASYKREGGRKDLMSDPTFAEAFRLAKIRIGHMDVRFIRIDDHNQQYLFEIYAALELRTKYNKFMST